MISTTEIFSIGIGPSSSHTVGPMRAASQFISQLPHFPSHVDIGLYGSLAATGRGHHTDRAVLLGLVGYLPTTISADIHPLPGTPISPQGTIHGPAGELSYNLKFSIPPLSGHPNGLSFQAYDHQGKELGPQQYYYSVGGGFIKTAAQLAADQAGLNSAEESLKEQLPYPFRTGAELLAIAKRENKTFAEIMRANEWILNPATPTDPDPLTTHLNQVWDTMRACVTAGISTEGELPGGLKVKRRAPGLYRYLCTPEAQKDTSMQVMDWTNLYALAVNEENAAGGKVVTAPTNGAAGIIPAVLHYARDFIPGFTTETAYQFLLTAAAVGLIIKENASISGAEVGCQGEVGSAASMAAAGLCAILGGSPRQVENAAEIALEHNLGLTCDPVGGLVQIPCIERNAIGAVKAINAARMAQLGDATNRVSLDDVIQTMAATGRDMLDKYKETSMGGLAITLGLPVSQTEC
ncbi:L-serine ammonia-lyase [Corynebacterium caspium]|uniref:L-serine ammonia-lyase n=1 Tax=Corynebacterium caspium TaxID=234828 RepID=UPI000372D913|nr:L-serine ammonia-lyase [Corynebacterium caspium]WKD59188.1 L-serine dehydratase 1 [Corynebacterium caspium DSM 44850]